MFLVLGYYFFSKLQVGYKNVNNIIDDYYNKRNSQDYEGAIKLLHPDFLEVTSKEKMLNLLTAVDQKLGQETSHIMLNYYINSDTDYGTTIEVSYSVNRTIYNSKETFILKKDGDDYKIIGLNIISDGFLEAATQDDITQLSPLM